jgi:hypothetical protein
VRGTVAAPLYATTKAIENGSNRAERETRMQNLGRRLRVAK